MAPRNWLAIARGSLLGLVGLAFLAFGLAFNPGWANGWPFGIPIDHVFSAGLSYLSFLILMTAAVGLGALTGAIASYCGVGPRRGLVTYSVWLVSCWGLALVASFWVYGQVHASALEMWPNGYHP